MKKTKKPLVGTWYAVQHAVTKAWLCINRHADLEWAETFPEATLWTKRGEAIAETRTMNVVGKYVIVPVRCRPLSTRTRASKHRTK